MQSCFRKKFTFEQKIIYGYAPSRESYTDLRYLSFSERPDVLNLVCITYQISHVALRSIKEVNVIFFLNLRTTTQTELMESVVKTTKNTISIW